MMGKPYADHDVRGGHDCIDHQWIYIPEYRRNECGVCREPARALLSFVPYADRVPPEHAHRSSGSCEELFDSLEGARQRLHDLRRENRIERADIYVPEPNGVLARKLFESWVDEEG